MSTNQCIVVGSGPAGAATAKALVCQGHDVVMIDTGRTLDEATQKRISKIASKHPDQWTLGDILFLKGDIKINSRGVEEKKIFGSSFANTGSDLFPVKRQLSKFYLSYAKGGLSNLWGRGILPLNEADQDDWPFPISALDQYYKKVLEFVPISGVKDDLETIYPLFSNNPQPIGLSSQSDRLLTNLGRNREILNKRGVFFGTTRLAANLKECNHCGMCLYGCPYGLLYCSGATIEELENDTRFSYEPGYVVQNVEEKGSVVYVHALADLSGTKKVFKGAKVFLAAGSISTTGIMLKSLRKENTPVYLKCSDLFYVPSISLKKAGNIVDERLITLSQIMLEIKDTDISRHYASVHCHGYNDLFLKMLQNASGAFQSVFDPLIKSFLNRFFVMFCFLHSDHSSKMVCSIDKRGQFRIKGEFNPDSVRVYKKIRNKLFKVAGNTGLIPFPMYAKKRLPGTSMHFGGSFPMSKTPQELQSDIYGRVKPFKQVYITDASILPTIPAGSYTFTIMANAFRIASEV